jgi:hypothetical protein
MLAEIQQDALSEDQPVLVAMAMVLVDIYERDHARPPVDILKGHYAQLADYIYAVGLSIGINCPKVAKELVDEPCPILL